MGGKSSIVIVIVVLLLLLPLFSLAEKPEDIKLDSYVKDYAGILFPEEKNILEAQLKEIYDSKKAEFAVVIIKSLDGRDIESFSYIVAEGKLGNKETNNGLLLLIAIEDRKYRFEVGRGLEPVLNDARIGRIGRDYLAPNFKKGDYFNGITDSIKSIKSILDNETDSNYYIQKNEPVLTKYGIMAIIIIIFLFLIVLSLIKSQSTPTRGFNPKAASGRSNNDYFLAGSILGGLGRGGFGGGGFGGGGAGGGW